MSDALELDQVDFAERLKADPYFSDITLLVQRKGVTESDIDVALSVLNEKSSKIGACVVLLMPELAPVDVEVRGPLYNIRATAQVIEQPLFNLGATGTGKSAEQIAQRVRQLLHHFSNGHGNTFVFDGMEPISADVGKISYGVKFIRRAGDLADSKVSPITIQATDAAAPATIALSTGTTGATIWYTTDGSYPSSENDNATEYTVPFVQSTAATIRAAAEKTGMQQSNLTQLILT